MKIVIINPILYTCETSYIKKVKSIKDSMIYHLCLEIKKQGHTPILIAAKDYQPEPKEKYEFEVIFLETIYKKVFKPNCFPLLKNIKKTLENINFDFIISSEVFSMNSLFVSTHYKNKAIIWHELAKHNNILKKFPSIFWYNIIAKKFFKNTRIIARSENARKFISQYCNNVSEEVIDHGVDLDEFIPLLEKEKQFVVVSQLIKRKNIDGIIKAFHEFSDYNNEFKLIIIGTGEEENNLKELCRNLDITSTVEFKGQMTHKEIVPILSKSYALVINTEKDNSMLSIVEAIATCTPIITTPIPYNCVYIRSQNLGIISDRITKDDFINMCKENNIYVNNCFNYRNKVSNSYHVSQFLKEGKSLIN